MAADTADTEPAEIGGMAAVSAGQEAGGSQSAQAVAATPAQAGSAAKARADAGNDHTGPGIPAGEAVEPEPAAAEQISEDGRAAEIEFNIAADIVYNRSRASWLTLCHRVLLIGAIIAGSTAASDLASAKLCAFAAAACAALDLVFDPATGAAIYRELVRAIHDVLVDLKQRKFSDASMDEAEVALLEDQRHRDRALQREARTGLQSGPLGLRP